MSQSCNGSDGRCSTAWNNLCGYVGALCINLETVIGGLIKNQALLRDKVEHYDERAEGFSSCAMLYLDTSTCQVVDTENDNTIPYGSHIGGGWIQPASEIICADVGLLNGELAPSCTPLDSNLDPATINANGKLSINRLFAFTLEQAESGGCTKIITTCCSPHPFTFRFSELNITQQSTSTLGLTGRASPTATFTLGANRGGRYTITTNLDGGDYNGNAANIGTWVIWDKVDGTSPTILFTEEQIQGIPGFGWQNFSSEVRCLEAGDVLTMYTSVVDSQDLTTNSAIINGIYISIDFLGECY